jgi:hypothetical protein
MKHTVKRMDKGTEQNAALCLVRAHIVSTELPLLPTYRRVQNPLLRWAHLLKHISLLPINKAITRMMTVS